MSMIENLELIKEHGIEQFLEEGSSKVALPRMWRGDMLS